MLKIKTVNKQFRQLNIKMELIKGKDYFYFIGEDVDEMYEGVYVYSLNELSLNDWIIEAQNRKKK